jgi:hypothetical protein
MNEELRTVSAATRDGGGDAAPVASPALASTDVSPGLGMDAAGAAAEASAAQEEPVRFPAEDRRTWWFRSLIALLAVLFAGLLAAGWIELRRNGVSVLVTAVIIGIFAIVCGVQVWGMALGYGFKEPRPEAGSPVPQEVKKSRWWRAVLIWWAVFNVLATIAAISLAISGDWGNFTDFGVGSILSWIGFGIAASGKIPSRDFRF